MPLIEADVKRVLVCGSRKWTDRDAIYNFLAFLTPRNVVIHGGAKGADLIAGEVAEVRGAQVEVYEAHWEQYGKGAGPIRNGHMLEVGEPDLVIAFGNGRGTDDMIRRATKAGVPVYRIQAVSSNSAGQEDGS